MTVTLDLPDEVVARLKAEAVRRGVTLDVLVGELASRLPEHALDEFIGSGASGRGDPFDIKDERALLAQALDSRHT